MKKIMESWGLDDHAHSEAYAQLGGTTKSLLLSAQPTK